MQVELGLSVNKYAGFSFEASPLREIRGADFSVTAAGLNSFVGVMGNNRIKPNPNFNRNSRREDNGSQGAAGPPALTYRFWPKFQN
jgi:hypothetical protein